MPSPNTNNWKAQLLELATSKTVWGGLLAAGAELARQPKIGPFEILRAIGEALIVIGARDALGKHTLAVTTPHTER